MTTTPRLRWLIAQGYVTPDGTELTQRGERYAEERCERDDGEDLREPEPYPESSVY